MNPYHPMSKKKIIILYAVIILIVVTLLISFLNAAEPFRKLRITIHNQSDYAITDIQTSLTQGDTSLNLNEKDFIYTLEQDLPSGKTMNFAPQLKPSGEASVYLQFTDSRGITQNKMVCGYTEYMSGNSDVTVTNESIAVKEDCM